MNKLLQGITHFTTRRWKIILIISVIFTMAAGYLSGLLFQNLDATWVSLVPKEAPVLIEYQRIMKLFKTANPIIITVKGENYDNIKNAIEAVAPELGKRKDMFRDVYYKNEIEFLKKYGLLITKTKNLTDIKRYLTDFNLVPFVKGINDTFESEYLGDESGLKKQEKNASFLIEGLYDFFSLLKAYGTGQEDDKAVKRSAYFFTTGPQYMISPDKKLGLIFAIPTVSINQVNETVELVDELDTILEKWDQEYPGIHFGQTGIHTVTRDEMKSSEEDSMLVTRLAFIFIIFLLIFSFRMRSAPVFGMLTLMAGISWCLGMSYLVVGSLNIVTAMVGAILVGLGIDYSIHIFAQYSEARASGHTPKESIAHTMKTSGRGIIIGAVTTMLAFGTLSFVSFRVLFEMGIITALGIFSCLLASLFLLPSLFMWRDTPSYQKLIKILTYALVIPLAWKFFENKFKKIKEKRSKPLISVNFKFLASFEKKWNKIPLLTVLIVLALTVFFFFEAKNLTFTGDWKKVEAKGLKSLELNDEILERFNMTVDTIVIVTNSLEEDQQYYQLLDKNPMIAYVDSISSYVPPLEEQEKRLEIIRQIAGVFKDYSPKEDVNLEKLGQEIHRFRQNMLEMRDLANIAGLDRLQKRCQRFLGKWTPANEKQSQPDFLQQLQQAAEQAASQPGLEKFQRLFYQETTQNFSAMLNPGNIHLQDLPGSIRRRLVSESGNQFLLAAYPIDYNWDNLDRNPFLINLQKTTPRASGMLLFMKEVVDTAKRDGEKVTLYALIAILILILIDFTNIRATLFIMLNIIVSIIWMIGILVLLGQQLNFINVLAVPLIIGIGIDDSVHIMHRYKQTGKGGLSTVLSSTGRAIFLTSLTTMCGFGSMYFARFQGIQSFGAFLFIGVGICFLMSVIFLPALMRIFPNIFKNKKAADKTAAL